jgi:hypothetical protein
MVRRSRTGRWALAWALIAAAVVAAGGGGVARAGAAVAPRSVGELDCNGQSKIQRPVRVSMLCADVVGYDGSKFTDNGSYIGHDEPSIRFLSSRTGSGNDVTFDERLPLEPSRLPTTGRGPGKDITHSFELSVAPWFGMALCDRQSYPENPCTPRSDHNAPTATFDGGGSAFTEMQFYPPGFPPVLDAGSCDSTHWCAAMLTFSLECTTDFAFCNPNCTEPVNFAFIQTNGVPTGPPGPQTANVSTFTPTGRTLLMNPGDHLRVHMFDAPTAGGGHALEERIDDLTTGRSGYMIASAANGFMHTNLHSCAGTPFNFQPAYSTAKPANIVPWAALEGNIFSQFEIGHFEPCSKIQNPVQLSFLSFTDRAWQTCVGPYEREAAPDPSKVNAEQTDAPCYFKGDTHGGRSSPDLVTGCEPVIGPLLSSSDLDYDGTSYWPDWPSSLRPRVHPSPFLQAQPTSRGAGYEAIQFQTDAPATEATCQTDGTGCVVPPIGAPGRFYPYWTRAQVGGACVWEFGQMQNGRTFGGAAQYGGPSARFSGTLESPIMPTPHC